MGSLSRSRARAARACLRARSASLYGPTPSCPRVQSSASLKDIRTREILKSSLSLASIAEQKLKVLYRVRVPSLVRGDVGGSTLLVNRKRLRAIFTALSVSALLTRTPETFRRLVPTITVYLAPHSWLERKFENRRSSLSATAEPHGCASCEVGYAACRDCSPQEDA